jgi:hypothetical protein
MSQGTRLEAQLDLIIRLFKDGAMWEGDLCSRTYLEFLAVRDDRAQEKVEFTLKLFTEGTDYKIDKNDAGKITGVWIKE